MTKYAKGFSGKMKKIISLKEAAAKVSNGMSVMIGGFISAGTPLGIIEELIQTGIGDLVLIANDTGRKGQGIGKLVAAGLIKEAVVSHIGTNPETGRKMNAGEIKVHFVPQGTLAERIRCAGAGIGGFLTPAGVGTAAAEGKPVVNLDGKEYLLEKGIKADVALLKASIADESGNLFYNGTTRNFNPLMALAADLVIAETDKIVAAGKLHRDHVMTPGILVDYICLSGVDAND
ncbi:MAG: 3-oxoacid CoA-transferase subunit A [Acidaminococcales bacterium]|nr:3-oxoacid CoA-transferase subunit A [Acidaminococcales bacterium]